MTLDNRLWILVASLLTAGLLAAGWFVGVQPQLALASELGMQRDATRAQNDSTRGELVALAKQQEELPALTAQYEGLSVSVPADVNDSSLIAELNAIAAETGVTITSVTVSAAAAYAPGGAEAAAPAPEPTESETGATDEASVEGAGEPVAAVSGAPLVDPAITAENFAVIPVTIEAQGSNEAVLTFLDRVQGADRLILVNRVQKTRGDAEAAAEFTVKLGGSIFATVSAPASGAEPAAEAAAAEAAE